MVVYQQKWIWCISIKNDSPPGVGSSFWFRDVVGLRSQIEFGVWKLQYRSIYWNLRDAWGGDLVPRHHKTTGSWVPDISHAGKCHNYWSRQKSDESEKLHCNDMLQLVRRLRRLHGIKGLHWIIHDDDNARNFGLWHGFWMRQKQVQETKCTTHSART